MADGARTWLRNVQPAEAEETHIAAERPPSCAIHRTAAANVTATDNLYHPALWWKTMCKAQWLGFDEFRKPDGSVIQVLRSTSDCDVEN